MTEPIRVEKNVNNVVDFKCSEPLRSTAVCEVVNGNRTMLPSLSDTFFGDGRGQRWLGCDKAGGSCPAFEEVPVVYYLREDSVYIVAAS